MSPTVANDAPRGDALWHARVKRSARSVARPTGVGRALATYEIPIEGRDEWLAAAELLA